MFLLSSQNNFYMILSSYVETYVKKLKSEFQSSIGFQAYKIWILFEKFNAEEVLTSLSDRNNSRESLVFGFSNVFHMNQES